MARMECGDNFMKYVLFFFNLVIVLVSAAMLVLGVSILVKFTFVTDLVQLGPLLKLIPPTAHKIVVWGIIGVGAVMFFVSFMGCCGAISESDCMVLMYAVILLVIIIIEVVVGVVVYTQRDNLINKKINSLSSTIGNVSEMLVQLDVNIDDIPEDFKSNLPKNVMNMIELSLTVQKEFNCCGIHGPSDYTNKTMLPKFCCSDGNVPCKLDKDLNYKGCWAIVEDSMTLILGTAIGFVCVQVVTAIFGLCLVNSLRNMHSY